MEQNEKRETTTYREYAEKRAKRSPVIKNASLAFLFGGAICVSGQGMTDLFTAITEDAKTASTCTSVTLIFIAALLTGIGVFDKIAHYAGAGTFIPITGFSNAMTSPAIDAKSEGLVLGVGAKIFSVAGPVILYGTLASALFGIVYYFVNLIGG